MEYNFIANRIAGGGLPQPSHHPVCRSTQRALPQGAHRAVTKSVGP